MCTVEAIYMYLIDFSLLLYIPCSSSILLGSVVCEGREVLEACYSSRASPLT